MSISPHTDPEQLHRVMLRPLYAGVVINVLAPAGLLLLSFYLHEQGKTTGPLSDMSQLLLILLAGLAAVDVVVALVFWQKNLKKKFATSATPDTDTLARWFLQVHVPTFAMIAAIAVYGFVFFFLTGGFQEALLFTVASFLIFQIVRPRRAATERFIALQQETAVTPTPD